MKQFLLLIAIVLLNCTIVKNTHYEIPARVIVTDSIAPESIAVEQQVFNEYIECGERLLKDSLISISPKEFARAATIVAYCESGLRTNIKSGDPSIGLNQITIKNLLSLNTDPDTFKKMNIKEQVIVYEKYLRNVHKPILKACKSSIDFHVINFAPSNAKKKILSKATNKYLVALDLNKDQVITKEDFVLFQDHRVSKTNKTFIRDLYYNVNL